MFTDPPKIDHKQTKSASNVESLHSNVETQSEEKSVSAGPSTYQKPDQLESTNREPQHLISTSVQDIPLPNLAPSAIKQPIQNNLILQHQNQLLQVRVTYLQQMYELRLVKEMMQATEPLKYL